MNVGEANLRETVRERGRERRESQQWGEEGE